MSSHDASHAFHDTLDALVRRGLSTPRLSVRRIEARDVPAMVALYGDARVNRFLPSVLWTQRDDAWQWWARLQGRMQRGEVVQCVIERPRPTAATARATTSADAPAMEVLGTCMLFDLHASSARAELGFALGHAWWGQGYMQEALAAWIEALFAGSRLHRLEAQIDAHNEAAARLLLRLGFAEEGLLRERWLRGDERCNVAIHGLLRPSAAGPT